MSSEEKDLKDLDNEETVEDAGETDADEFAGEVIKENPDAEMSDEEISKEGHSEENDDSENEKESADPKEKKDKKNLFGKKKDKKDEMIEELKDKNTRLMAEFQNFRNRSEKEKSAMFEIGAKTIIEKILPVVDNFERGLATLSEEDLNSPVGQGMTMIYKQFTTALEEMGVEVIEAVGCEFNPELHNAVMHVDDENAGENVVVQEFQKGYTYRGTVIRHSMVQVAN